MPCYTLIQVDLEDTDLMREAREALGIPREGPLSVYDADRVRREASVIKARRAIRRVAPRAVVRRHGAVLTVTVGR